MLKSGVQVPYAPFNIGNLTAISNKTSDLGFEESLMRMVTVILRTKHPWWNWKTHAI